MYGKADLTAFDKAFDRLLTLPNRLRDDKSIKAAKRVYADVLEEYPVQAVVLAAERMLRVGTSSGWFPSPPEWSDAALGMQIELERNAIAARRRALPAADPEVERAELATMRGLVIERARREHGDAVAEALEKYPLRLPSEDRRHLHCDRCSDTGIRADGPDAARICECADTNPRRSSQALEARRRARLRERRVAAADLSPRAAAGLLEG